MHIFVTGPIGAGKSTLIEKLLVKLNKPVYGFVTKRFTYDDGTNRIFIRSASDEFVFDDAHCVAINSKCTPSLVNSHVFDTFGAGCLSGIPDGSVVLMDELGFMESSSEVFKRAVLCALDSDVTVIGAIKPMPSPFLDAIRERRDVNLVVITKETREAASEEALALLK